MEDLHPCVAKKENWVIRLKKKGVYSWNGKEEKRKKSPR